MRQIPAAVAVLGLTALALVGCAPTGPADAGCERVTAPASSLDLVDVTDAEAAPAATTTDPVYVTKTSFTDIATTAGAACDGVEMRIADDGEVLVRGYTVMQGYFDDPVATAEAIDAEGWFRTGDAGYRDPAGYPVPETKLEGKGEALIFNDGRLVRGTWSKDGLDDALKLSTRAGELTVPAGRTFIELVPAANGNVTFK